MTIDIQRFTKNNYNGITNRVQIINVPLIKIDVNYVIIKVNGMDYL